jgi:hypothetical protein
MTQFITSNLENHNQIQQTGFTANLNALFPWPPLMPKHREWHIGITILLYLLEKHECTALMIYKQTLLKSSFNMSYHLLSSRAVKTIKTSLITSFFLINSGKYSVPTQICGSNLKK